MSIFLDTKIKITAANTVYKKMGRKCYISGVYLAFKFSGGGQVFAPKCPSFHIPKPLGSSGKSQSGAKTGS